MIAQDTQRDISTVTPNTAALKLNCCLRGISAKFRTTISYAGRQDARNVRGHFSKAQRCGSQSSSDSCLATLHYLIFIYIIFNTLTLIPRSHPGFSPKRVQHFRGEGGGGGRCLFAFYQSSGNNWVLPKRTQNLRAFCEQFLERAVCSFQPQFCITTCIWAGCFSKSTSQGYYLLSASCQTLGAFHEEMGCTDSIS